MCPVLRYCLPSFLSPKRSLKSIGWVLGDQLAIKRSSCLPSETKQGPLCHRANSTEICGIKEAKQPKQGEFAKSNEVLKTLSGVHCLLIENVNFPNFI